MEIYGSVKADGLTESERYSRVQNAFTTTLNKHLGMRKEQVRALEYSVNKILDEETKALLRSQGRTPLEFPIATQTLLYIAGTLRTEMRKFKAVPKQEGTEQLADLATQRNEWAMEVSRGYKNLARAGMYSAIAKRGAVNVFWDYTNDTQGEPCVEAVDPMLLMFDPDPGQNRFVFYFPMVSVEEIIRIYRKYLDDDTIAKLRSEAEQFEGRSKGDSGKPVGWFERISGDIKKEWNRFRGLPDSWAIYDQWMDSNNGLYRLVECHDLRTEIHKFAYSPQSRDFEEIPEDMLDDRDYHQQILAKTKKLSTGQEVPLYPDGIIHEVPVEKVWVTSICPALLPDRLLIEEPHEIQGRGFQFKRMDCYDWHPDPTLVTSVMDSLEAPTKFYNHHQMSLLALLKDAMNPGVDAPENSIDPSELENWKNNAKRGLRFFKYQQGLKPEERSIPAKAFKLAEIMAETAKELVDFIPGIGQNAKGFEESSGESGTLFEKRQRQTQVMIGYFFAQLEEMTHDVFIYLDELMDVKMKGPRKLPITSDVQGTKWATINTDESNTLAKTDFYYIPDVRSLGESARQEKFLTMSQLMERFQFDPVLLLKAGQIMTHFLDIPEAKELEMLIGQRLQMMLGQEQKQQMMGDAAAKLAMVEKVTNMRQNAGTNGGGKPGRKQLPARQAA